MVAVVVNREILVAAIAALAAAVLLDRHCRTMARAIVPHSDRARHVILWLLRLSLFGGLFALAFFAASYLVFEL